MPPTPPRSISGPCRSPAATTGWSSAAPAKPSSGSCICAASTSGRRSTTWQIEASFRRRCWPSSCAPSSPRTPARPLRDGAPAAESLRRYLRQNQEAFAESPELFPRERAQALIARSRDALKDQLGSAARARPAGFVRRCHGDLHLRNLVLLEGEPTLFDAVEFDDAIATGDVLYDLAFLLMDLWERDLKSEANLVLNRYLWGHDEEQIRGLAALPIFLSIRATIRAKVIAASLPHLTGSAREGREGGCFALFRGRGAFLEPAFATLWSRSAGFPGAARAHSAAAIAPFIGRPPGAVHLRSDIERKLHAGVAETERLPKTAYAPTAAEAVYATLRRKAELAVAAGHSAVVDAVHACPAERERIATTAANAGALFVGLWLEAPTTILVDRVSARSGDASDATEEVVLHQASYDLGAIGWHRLDAARSPHECAAEALRMVAAELQAKRADGDAA